MIPITGTHATDMHGGSLVNWAECAQSPLPISPTEIAARFFLGYSTHFSSQRPEHTHRFGSHFRKHSKIYQRCYLDISAAAAIKNSLKIKGLFNILSEALRNKLADLAFVKNQ